MIARHDFAPGAISTIGFRIKVSGVKMKRWEGFYWQFFITIPLSITIQQQQNFSSLVTFVMFIITTWLSSWHPFHPLDDYVLIQVSLSSYSLPSRHCLCWRGRHGTHTQVVGTVRSSRSLGLTRCYDDTWSSNAWPMRPLMIQYDTSCLHAADDTIWFEIKANINFQTQVGNNVWDGRLWYLREATQEW